MFSATRRSLSTMISAAWRLSWVWSIAVVLLPVNFTTTVVPYAWDWVMARMGRYENLARAAKLEAEPLRNPATILISVVVPAYKEATSVLRTIRHATEQMGTQLRTEFIVAAVDDETAQRVEESELPITVVRCASGRSSALNAGAALARGEVLLFVHADCLLPRFWDMEVRTAACREGVVLGAFRFDVDCEGRAAPPGLRTMTRLARLRSTILQLPYGDQALFVRRDRFHGLGGFGDMPLMEDFDFVRRLRRAGMHATCRTGREYRVCVLPLAVQCSVRRWERKGVAGVTLVNQAMLLLHLYAGVSASTLYRLYYGRSLR